MKDKPHIEKTQKSRDADKTIQVLFEISNALNSTSRLDELYRSIHRSLGKILNVDNFYIALYHEKTDSITFPYYVDEIGDVYEEIKNVSQTGIKAGEVIRTKQPLLITKSETIEQQKEIGKKGLGVVSEQWLGVPLEIKQKVIGVLVVQSYSDANLYSEEELGILSSVSYQIALAIDRKRVEEAILKSEALNKTLFEISDAVNKTLSIGQLCKYIHASLKKVLNIVNFSLAIYDKSTDIMSVLYSNDKTLPSSEFKNVSKSTSMVFQVIKTGKPLLLNAQEQIDLVKSLGGKMIGKISKSWLCVPLKIKGESVGAILTQDYEINNCFSKADVELLTMVSEQIALTVERKRAEDAEKESREINRVMFAISNAVNTVDRLDDLYRAIHKNLASILDVTNFMIGIYDAEKDSITYPYFVDQTSEIIEEISNVSKSGIVAYEVIKEDKPFFISGEEAAKRAKNQGFEIVGEIAEQWLGVPLRLKTKVIGVIVVQSYTDPELYSEQDVDILLSVSNQIAVAIDRKKAEEDIRYSEKVTRTLFSISNAVNTTDNLTDLYLSIYDSLNALIELPNFFIAIVDVEKQTMYFPLYKDQYDTEDTISFTVEDYKKTASITTDVIESKRALFLKKEDFKKVVAEKKIVGAVPVIWMGVPLVIRNEVIGVIAAQHYSDPDYFREKELNLFMLVSEQIALAIERKRSQEIIIEREKQILQLSRQSQEFSMVAASIISIKDDKEIFKLISQAIVKHSDYNRLIISYFTDHPPYREIIRYEGISEKEIEATRNKNTPPDYFEKVFEVGEKLGELSWYLPHTKKEILGTQVPIFLDKKPPLDPEAWHPQDTIFIKMTDSEGNFVGVISVDDSRSGKKPTKETARPLEIFSSLISQIMIFKKLQNELKDHKENLERMVNERTKELTIEIEERKEVEKKLKKAKQDAEAAAKIKGEFLTNMSHEIRTPINGIMGMAEIALGNVLDDDLQKILETIDSEANSLLGIINQILDFSKIEAGKLSFEKISFDMRNMFEKVCSFLSMGINKKGIEFISYFSPEIPSKLIGDPVRIRQVLLNLAENALKFTHKGEIFLKVEMVENQSSEVKIRFIVKDTGIGIKKSKQKGIFDSFSQADGTTTRKYGGTGLGTTISKQLVELMGGEIGMESEIDKGSIFWFDLPLMKQEESPQKIIEEPFDLSGRKILVADDNKHNQFALVQYLKSFGIEAISCETDEKGLALLEEEGGFDAVITDFKNTSLSGFRFAESIRAKYESSKLPVIMLTATGKLGDGQACKEIGIDAYLLKPVTRDDLKKAIAMVLCKQTIETKQTKKLITRHTIAEESANVSNILLVEDYATNQEVAMKHLKSAGFNAVLAENGKEAVDFYKSRSFDLVLMDIQMPVMDGYQATKNIRRYEKKLNELKIGGNGKNRNKARRIPIVAMTAHAIEGYREKCLEADMDDYITKPIRKEKLLITLAKWLKKNYGSEKQNQPDGKSKKQEEEGLRVQQDEENIDVTDVTTAWKNNSPIDYTEALKEFDEDEAFLIEVIEQFLDTVNNQITLIREAIGQNNAETVTKESHSIKGGAANLCAFRLSEVAHRLELIGKSKDLDKSLDLCENLEAEYNHLKKYLEIKI